MCEVTRKNFEALFPAIERNIKSAAFIGNLNVHSSSHACHQFKYKLTSFKTYKAVDVGKTGISILLVIPLISQHLSVILLPNI